jgi:hypothetical protein
VIAKKQKNQHYVIAQKSFNMMITNSTNKKGLLVCSVVATPG